MVGGSGLVLRVVIVVGGLGLKVAVNLLCNSLEVISDRFGMITVEVP